MQCFSNDLIKLFTSPDNISLNVCQYISPVIEICVFTHPRAQLINIHFQLPFCLSTVLYCCCCLAIYVVDLHLVGVYLESGREVLSRFEEILSRIDFIFVKNHIASRLVELIFSRDLGKGSVQAEILSVLSVLGDTF